jgi:predicted DCC family thiol-disulfide oxidoreductase YuxK
MFRPLADHQDTPGSRALGGSGACHGGHHLAADRNTGRPMNLVLYDGVCGLCNRLVQFILKRDTHDRFRFAALQSPVSRELLKRYDRNPDDLDTLYLVVDYGQATQRVLWKGRAAVRLLSTLGGIWSWVRVANILPTPLLDLLYGLIATHRYKWFGRSEQCILPSPQQRSKFIDVG